MTTSHVDALAQDLVDAGVEHAFGVTGSGSSYALISALQSRGCPFVGVGHEGAAALMAGACGRDGRLRAAAITIKGPGFANLLPGILSNAYEGRATVSISEAYAADAPAWRRHKRADHRALAGSMLKGYARVDGSATQGAWVRSVAESEYPGPVHLDLGPVADCGTPEVLRGDESPGDVAAIDEVADLIAHALRPVVVLGSFAARYPGSPDWNALRVPVVTTAAAKGVYDERLPWSAGVITGERGELAPETTVMSRADLVVGIGFRNEEVVAAGELDVPGVFVDAVGPTVREGFGDVRAVAADPDGLAVYEALVTRTWGADVVAEHRALVEAHVLADDWQLGAALRTIAAGFDVEPVLVPDTGFFCTVAESTWLSASPRSFCGSSVGRFMGTSIPTAIGIAISERGTPVVALFGDGGASPYFGELRIAVRQSLPILFAMASDGRYGSVAAFTNPGSSAVTLGGGDVDWCTAARGLGCEAAVVDSPASLESALSSWQHDGPLFLQMTFDPARYAAIARRLR